MKGSQFLKYVNPVLETLQEMGGAGNGSEVIDRVIERMRIPEAEVEELITSGQSRVRNRIQWARSYLAQAGFINSSQRGRWELSEKGYGARLSEQGINDMFRLASESFKSKSQAKKIKIASEVPENSNEDETTTEEKKHTGKLLKMIQALSPSGFERLCKRLLTECGFQNVQVTGKAGDNGIDGIGILEINSLVTFKVLFQCKRFKETVGPDIVRDFRGAMQGRADKGIILTTGRFTINARNEAIRDGVPPIELVDGEKLVDMFEKYNLGLKPKVVYDIDPLFFDEFR